MNAYEVREVVQQEVRRALMFYRHYWGTVLSTDDRLGIGRIQVSLPDLRLTTRDSAPWCAPRYAPGVTVPYIGSVVEVYFVEGNSSRPVWLGRVPEQAERLASYSSGVAVLHEDQGSGDAITYDSQEKKYHVTSGGAAAAREGDATNVDLTTDPTNMAMIVAVCAIFGMTVTPPLVGKIVEGSSKVDIGG